MTDIERKNIEIQDSIEILENTNLDINCIECIDLRTYSYAVKTVLNYCKDLAKENQEKDEKVNKIVNRLYKDVDNITKTKNEKEHVDDYTRNRLKAYRTKTNEIAKYIENVYFGKE